MRYKILIEKKAHKELLKLNERDRERITKTILRLDEPFSHGLDLKKLKGYKNKFRLRVGAYRILFEMERESIRIFAVLKRRKAYRQI